MRLRTKVLAAVSPLIIALAVLTVTGMVTTRSIVLQLTEITDRAIPLNSVVARITENQLEQAIWFERFLSFVASRDGESQAEAAGQFERLNGTVRDEIAMGIKAAEEAALAAKRPASRGEFRKIRQSLEEIATQRGLYEETALRVMALLSDNSGPPSADPVERPLAAVRELEDQVHNELESVRARFARYTEEATAEVLRIERLVMIFMIVGAALLLLIGLIAFPLLLLHWE
ncbi:MAG: hypothetical protein JW820_13635 [Spirochaetales bacterium]|nr:hypothetical protein [Spirochaetales bacterium]